VRAAPAITTSFMLRPPEFLLVNTEW